jgi:hypothetical protein
MACVTQCPPFFGHLVAQTTQIKQPQKKTTKKRSQKSPKKEQSTPTSLALGPLRTDVFLASISVSFFFLVPRTLPDTPTQTPHLPDF